MSALNVKPNWKGDLINAFARAIVESRLPT